MRFSVLWQATCLYGMGSTSENPDANLLTGFRAFHARNCDVLSIWSSCVPLGNVIISLS